VSRRVPTCIAKKKRSSLATCATSPPRTLRMALALFRGRYRRVCLLTRYGDQTNRLTPQPVPLNAPTAPCVHILLTDSLRRDPCGVRPPPRARNICRTSTAETAERWPRPPRKKHHPSPRADAGLHSGACSIERTRLSRRQDWSVRQFHKFASNARSSSERVTFVTFPFSQPSSESFANDLVVASLTPSK